MGSSCMKCGKKDLEPSILPEKNETDFKKLMYSQQSTNFKIEEDLRLARSTGVKVKHKAPRVDARRSIDESDETMTAIVSDKPKSLQDRRMILDALNNHFILKNLDTDSQHNVTQQMKFYEIGPRELIFEQGQPGLCFYILASGRVEIVAGGVRIDTIRAGAGFGELALLDDRPRSATAKTIERCTL